MRKLTKPAAYLAAVGVAGFFGYRFSREHAIVLSQAAGASRPAMMFYLALVILSVIVLGLICAFDLRTFVRNRTESWMLQASSPTGPVPELEEAQKIRAAGQPLDAIRLLREYLQANPYEVHVMSRIAEIYRYDLKNDLAAALEYEEMLKRKLPDDQWAWAALHLAKLYGRLNELEKSVALLERLDDGYSHTIAGRRAQKALEHVRNPDAQPPADDDSETGEVGDTITS
jgi:tetratricopeptide (TPR) repeat protein